MSVLIKSMAMPDNCYECRFMEVIERREGVERYICLAHLNRITDLMKRLDTCPLEEPLTIDPKKVVEDYCRPRNLMVVAAENFRLFTEPKPGKWIYPTDIVGFGRCGNCKALWSSSLITNKFVKYCPRCGHPMELSEEEFEDDNWYTELDDPKFDEWSEDEQT